MSEQAAAQAPETPTVAENATVQPTAAPETEKQDQLSPKFAALTRLDQQVRRARQQFKAQQAEFMRQRAEFDKQRTEWESEFKTSPFDALKKRGRTYEDLTQAALEGGRFKPEVEVKDLRSELDRYKNEQAAKEKKNQELALRQIQAQEQQIVAEFREGVAQTIKSEPEKYELTNRYDPDGDLVWQTVEEHWKRGESLYKSGKGPAPKALTKAEAIELVESYYESELEKELTELPNTKRFQSKWKDKLGQSKKEDQPMPRSGGSTTLTNSMSSAAPTFVSQKTENDRMARAMAALNK